MPISAHEDNVSHGLIKYIREGLPIAVVLLIMQLNDKQTPSCADIFFWAELLHLPIYMHAYVWRGG